MRILDKNTDFYDFWQGVYYDPTTTFDRTDSFLLTKELMCEHLYNCRCRYRHHTGEWQQNFLLLQIGHAFWIFLIDVTIDTVRDLPTDYTIELITAWKNYDSKRRLIALDIIDFGYEIQKLLCGRKWVSGKFEMDKVIGRAPDLIQAVNTGNYRVLDSIDRHRIYHGDFYSRNGTVTEKHIPLLKACGISACVDPLEIYLAFEEYFSLEKTRNERTESVGLTDKEKVSNHGFDVKTSFRGHIKIN